MPEENGEDQRGSVDSSFDSSLEKTLNLEGAAKKADNALASIEKLLREAHEDRALVKGQFDEMNKNMAEMN